MSSGSRLAGRVAFITGAAGGIGSAIARGFAEAGTNLCLADHVPINPATAGVTAQGDRVIAATRDVMSGAEINAAIDRTLETFGRLDILVNIAGAVTNLIVEATARAADDAGFAVTALEDLCAAQNPAWHEFSVENMLPLFASVKKSEALLSEPPSA